MKFSDYDKAINYLMYELPKSGKRVFRGEDGLAKTKKFFEKAGSPQQGLKAVHVAGTTGKGTVCYMIDAILREHGFSTTLILSPHVYDIRERYQVNGHLQSKQKILDYINQILPIIEQSSAIEKPTYFQVNTLIGFLSAKKSKSDYAVVETGLGGMYDSTNVLESEDKLCVITRIGMDHTDILGNTITEITAQKAGIIHNKNIVVAINQQTDINHVLKNAAKNNNASLDFVDSKNVKFTNQQMQISFQKENFALAFTTCAKLAERDSWKLSKEKSISAVEGLKLPGRFEQRFTSSGQEIIFDGSHNAQKIEGLVGQFKKIFGNKKAVILMALKQDKDAELVVKALLPIVAEFVFTRFLSNQDMAAMSHDPEQLKNIAQKFGVKADVADSAKNAIKLITKSENLALVTGSNYLLGEVAELLDFASDSGN